MFRLENIPDLARAILLPADDVVTALLVFSLLIFAWLIFFLMSIISIGVPSRQELYLINKLSDISNRLEYKALNVKEKSIETEKKREMYEKDTILYNRLRLDITPDEYTGITVFNIVIGLIMMVVLMVITIVINNIIPNPLLLVFLMVASLGAGLTRMFKLQILIFRKYNQLNEDILDDLYMFLSVYQYSDISNFYHFIRDYQPTSNSLKVDLSMLLSDLNGGIPIPDALDSMTKRINIQEVHQFGTIVKSNLTGQIGKDEYRMNIKELTRTLGEKLQQKADKKFGKQILSFAIVMMIGFSAAAMLGIIDKVLEIEKGMTGIF